MTRLSSRRSAPVRIPETTNERKHLANHYDTDEKARKELASKAGGKGPLNTGGQGIKKSGKK
ncbi:uncharacterized protein BKA55DRAFT_576053 [Fusarium redolens]|uniref:Uncharacterized protein n=1 Tax=Fusarium redolens TaxID=48865 RepID=A0A9P9GLW4_FUSRE|nr:uncharacterized protein BKA55DRAFT_576053 [Fusarium redolens]KAH7240935.1 hypothetical protein BKA55DRAFT_576053 [Fusarium redolens]